MSLDSSCYQNYSMLKTSVKDCLTYPYLNKEHKQGMFVLGAQRGTVYADFPLGRDPFPVKKSLMWHCTGTAEVQYKSRLYYCQHCMLTWLNGFLAHTSVQWYISNNHKEMLPNSLISMINEGAHGDSMAVLSILLCVFIYTIGGVLILSYIFMNKYCLLYKIKLERGTAELNQQFIDSIVSHVLLLNMIIFEVCIDINSHSKLFIQQLCECAAKHNA